MKESDFTLVAPRQPHGALTQTPGEARRPRRRPLLSLLAAVISLVVFCICIEAPTGVEADIWKELKSQRKLLKSEEKLMKKFRKKLRKYNKKTSSGWTSSSRTKAKMKAAKYVGKLKQQMLVVKENVMKLQSKMGKAKEELKHLSGRKQRKKQKKIDEAQERLVKTSAEYKKAISELQNTGENIDDLTLPTISSGGDYEEEGDGSSDDDRDVRKKS
ncbi:conserved hypothetical protein [Neospora caninum Liverpool]|uniref:Uncharacterized protein n=1 Tax=Neospora caninum (strain Liverpool) TaxID=572307 RepID=F0VNL4_NEOCL|nr:conserved hypothetical protein [Neospora caninum Liverpool]CBZ55310.1 conserved hypothetical protein [Neospora caninum Liverpool]CEL70042.1 TPA: hypothetical protein BN1204_057330 [Neospora caninum Liverpool]|eukprot:XP_003885338.1 conserved hypothetical protein [Neospora caninum Liverpool]